MISGYAAVNKQFYVGRGAERIKAIGEKVPCSIKIFLPARRSCSASEIYPGFSAGYWRRYSRVVISPGS